MVYSVVKGLEILSSVGGVCLLNRIAQFNMVIIMHREDYSTYHDARDARTQI